jgi:hypothetical protein
VSQGMKNAGRRACRHARWALGMLGIVGVVAALPAQASAAPPSRGYELVSPQDKNGGDLDRDITAQDWATFGAATAGDAVAYSGSAQFADGASGAPQMQYLSNRTSSGWLTRSISPPFDAEVLNPPALGSPRIPYLAPDLKRAIAMTNVPLTDSANDLGGSWGLYMWQDGAPTWQLLSDPFAPLPSDVSTNVPSRFEFSGASEDTRHVLFASLGRQLTPDAPPGDDLATGRTLYLWSDGQLKYVSAQPNGDPTATPVGGARAATYLQHPGDNFVSNDGRRVFFTDGLDTGLLYMNQDGTTVPIAVSQIPNDNPNVRNATYWTAEAETGSRALFASFDRLTEDATAGGDGGDVYMWDSTRPEGQRLVDLTTSSPNGAGAIGFVGAAKDLRRAYFVASSALTGDANPNAPNLYSWSEADGVELVAELTGMDASVWSYTRATIDGLNNYRDARTTPDGSKLVFVSGAQLTDYDNAGQRQVYMWDAATKETTCVSCSSALPASTGETGLYPARNVLSAFPTIPYRLSRNLSADGSSVIFETAQALLPQDSNAKADVYEWKDGQLALVSRGQGNYPSQFVDASADGRDVFFITRERLVGSDRDNQSDMYDARIGGGFPESSPPILCQGDACQGSIPNSPVFAPPATSTATSGGNATPRKTSKAKKKKKCARGQVRKKVKGKSRCVKKKKQQQRRQARTQGRRR